LHWFAAIWHGLKSALKSLEGQMEKALAQRSNPRVHPVPCGRFAAALVLIDRVVRPCCIVATVGWPTRLTVENRLAT